MQRLKTIPLFVYLLLIYNILAFAGDPQEVMRFVWLNITLISGAPLALAVGDILTILGMVALYFEIFKATRGDTASALEHTYSMLVFVIFLVEFIVVKGAGTSVFLILTIMSFLDVVAGFTVGITAARRDIRID
jgi:hypothetical protein